MLYSAEDSMHQLCDDIQTDLTELVNIIFSISWLMMFEQMLRKTQVDKCSTLRKTL